MTYRKLMLHAGFVSLLASSVAASAQLPLNFEFGVRAGVPFTSALSNRLSGASGLFSNSSFPKPAFNAGTVVGVIVHDRIGFEFDAIYKPIKMFNTSRTGPVTQTLSVFRGSSWEFPVLANYRIYHRPIRPFAGGGIVLGSTLAGTTETRTRDLQTGIEGSSTTSSRTSIDVSSLGTAFVFNGGLEWRHSRVLIRPEFRYTRRPDANTNTFLFRSANQFEYLVGFSLLARSADRVR